MKPSLEEPISKPSQFYQQRFWKFGYQIARKVPRCVAEPLVRCLARIYALGQKRRHQVLVQNLLVPCSGDLSQARKMANQLFQNFAIKLLDLWRYETGGSVENLFQQFEGIEHLDAALKSGSGVLIVTVHLGNWEFGAPLISKRGVPLMVVTLAEPDPGLTEIRKQSRQRWGVETVVIGENPFSFVEVVRRLDQGGVVAILIDRPPPTSAVEIELFGKKFLGSLAAVELARATGCIILPVFLPRLKKGYAAHVLPPVVYQRPLLRSLEERRKLTQKILDGFASPIRQYPDQWYHFVPIWPEPQAAMLP